MAKAFLLDVFLSAVRGVHGTSGGTKETSYYPALNNLLDGIGDKLKPKVHCVNQLKNMGAGSPDVGLFTADQIARGSLLFVLLILEVGSQALEGYSTHERLLLQY